MKRSPLKRSPMRRGKRKNKYARRPRALAYMSLVRTLPCCVPQIFHDRTTPPRSFDRGVTIALFSDLICTGPIEANHAGERIAGLGTKSKDRDCIPMCKGHHGHWTEYKGVFAGLTHEQRRDYAAHAIAMTHEIARGFGIEIPDA